MNKTYEIKIYDSLEQLPSNCWKKQLMISFEKVFAVKWYTIFAFDGDSIIGMLRILRNPDDVSNWWIFDLHTLDQYRRTGIATKMYDAAFHIIKEYDAASSIIAFISATNRASISLHNKLGFRNTSTVPQFADFCFEADETMYTLWLSQCYPAKNFPRHIDLLRPMWMNYMREIGEVTSESESEKELLSRIHLSENHEHIFFRIIWSGNDAVGFASYSIDGGIKNIIPPGYGYIMEFYLLEHWRKRGIASSTVSDICNNLKELGCSQIYLTSVHQSEHFWLNNGFHNSGLIDPDNELPIFIKDL